ncbi:hypothetical protein GCM10008170_21550 [Methylopila capsulata]|uniref:Uncharacterized protein n=1 Tax=Methylopila capsulata TaxID=61654 RepID=A0A9W6IW04_9HYPH|nr:hypothetical protein GCM10008170_21550 [Methylopila capsulata]
MKALFAGVADFCGDDDLQEGPAVTQGSPYAAFRGRQVKCVPVGATGRQGVPERLRRSGAEGGLGGSTTLKKPMRPNRHGRSAMQLYKQRRLGNLDLLLYARRVFGQVH